MFHARTRWVRGLANERRPRRRTQYNPGNIHTCRMTGILASVRKGLRQICWDNKTKSNQDKNPKYEVAK